MRHLEPALVVVLVGGVGLASEVVGGQAPATATTVAAAGGTAFRTSWGDPDLQGIWSTDDSIGVPIERPAEFGDRLFLTEAEFADRVRRTDAARDRSLEEFVAPAPGAGTVDTGPPSHWGEQASKPVRQTSLIVDPPDGRIPALTPQALQRAAGRDRGSFGGGPFNGPEDLTNYDRCISRSVVGSFVARPYGNGLQIVQAPGYVAIRHEMIHDTRLIPVGSIGDRPRLGAAIRQYMGDSRARWEGRTLVVETTNLTGKTSIGLNGNGLRHSEAMRFVERFTRMGADRIDYEVTIEDPGTYVRPWTMSMPLTTQSGYQVFEYACHEGNYGLPNILSAARAEGK